MKRILIPLLLFASIARADFRVAFIGDDFRPLEAGSASCVREVLDSASGDGTYVVRNCTNDQTRGIVSDFLWLPAMPAYPGTITWLVEALPSATGNVCLGVSLWCGSTASGTFTATTQVSTNVASLLGYARLTGTVAIPLGVLADKYCRMKVIHKIGDGTCVDDVHDVRIRSAFLSP